MTEPFGIYLHWPFCSRICPYCDFNVYRDKGPDHAAWQKALVEDLQYWHEQTAGRKITSFYFGGGTPSLMPPPLVAGVLEEATNLWGMDEQAEITLEANPTDAEAAHFTDFAAAGVNRLSLGVQSLNDEALKFLGRNHSAQEAKNATALAARLFTRTTIDLIYARPEQGLRAWQAELEEAIALGINHLSLYQLTIEPGTAFHNAVARKDWQPPEEGLQADFYDLTQAICEAHDLAAYEVSNHAKPGSASRHNQLYWQYHDYLGIGPGAHGRVTMGAKKKATVGTMHPAHYLQATPPTRYQYEDINKSEQGIEYLSMALRLKTGASLARYKTLAGHPLQSSPTKALILSGHLVQEGDRLATTPAGRKVLNSVLLELFS